MALDVRFKTHLIVISVLVGAVAGCSESNPIAVRSEPRGLTPAQTGQVPEEEILGGFFSNAQPASASLVSGITITISHQSGKGCIFAAKNPSICRTTAPWNTMQALSPSSTPGGSSGVRWGWFDNLDTDNNPCRSTTADKSEAHDLNGDGLRTGLKSSTASSPAPIR